MFDSHKNFAYSPSILTVPSPAVSGVTLVLPAGIGARFPAAATANPASYFNIVIWPVGQQPLSTNAEIARCTNRSGDTLTIIRAQEGSSARTILTSDQVINAITVKTLTDLEALLLQERFANVIPRIGRVSNRRGVGVEVGDRYVNIDPTGGIALIPAYDVVNHAAFTQPQLGGSTRTAIYKIFTLIGSTGSPGTAPNNSPGSRAANDWLDKDLAVSIGTSFLNHRGSPAISGDGRSCPDPACVNYQQGCIAAAADTMRTLGATTFFVDTVGDNAISALLGYVPDEYEDDYDYMQRGMLSFVRAVFPAVRALGGNIIANAGGDTVGPFSYESHARFDSTMRWWTILAPYVDGFLVEYWTQSAKVGLQTYRVTDSIAEIGTGGPDDWWRGMMRLPQHAYDLNKAFYGWTYGTNSTEFAGNDANVRYAVGCDLLAWNGKHEGGVFYGFANAVDTTPTYKWVANEVHPTGDRERIAAWSWVRPLLVDGVAKTLLVNTDGTAPHTIAGVSIPACDARVV